MAKFAELPSVLETQRLGGDMKLGRLILWMHRGRAKRT